MIEQVTVSELYARKGFEEMIEEYAKLAIKKLPSPLYRKEDYLPLEAAGLLTVWCAMHNGIVIGFASCLLSRIPHYGIGIAIGESLFVRETYRSTWVGTHFIAAIERHARANKAAAVFMSCPLGSEYANLLERRNYSAETTTYVKSLSCN